LRKIKEKNENRNIFTQNIPINVCDYHKRKKDDNYLRKTVDEETITSSL